MPEYLKNDLRNEIDFLCICTQKSNQLTHTHYWVCSDMARNTQCTFKEMNLYYLKKKIFYTSLDIYRSNLLIQTFQTKMVKYISASPKLFECYVLQTLSVECNYFQDCFQACFFPVVIYYDAKHLV